MNETKKFFKDGVGNALISTMDSATMNNKASLLTTINISLDNKENANQYRSELNAAIKTCTDRWFA